jgi:signal transduction histidine kinase
MMHLNLFTTPPLLAFILNMTLAYVALQQNASHRLHRLFAAWNLCVASWNLATLVMHAASSAETAMVYSQWIRNIFLFIYPVYLHLILEFTGQRGGTPRRVLQLSYLSSALLVVANQIPGWMVKGMSHFYWGYYPEAGPAAGVYALAFYLVIGYAMAQLWRALKESTGYRQSQCQYLFAASLMVFVSTISNFLIVFGVSVFPFGSFFNILFSILIAHAVTTYGLMDMRIAMRKSVVYATLGVALTIAYELIDQLLRRMFLEHDTISASYCFHLAAVPITFAIAPRLRSLIEPWVQRAPWWRGQERDPWRQGFGSAILTQLEMSDLTRSIVQRLSLMFKTGHVALFVERPDDYKCCASVGSNDDVSWPLDHPVIHYLQTKRRLILRERMIWEHENRKQTSASSALLRFLADTNFEVIQPLIFRQKLLGCVGLGSKLNGEMFNSDDMELLKTLSEQMALALNNARSLETIEEQKRQLEAQKEMVFMGTMATEMAHELTKPLTHIMNAGTRLTQANQPPQESLRIIERETQRAAEMLDGFSMLSPARHLVRMPVSLASIMEEAISNLGLHESSHLRIVRHFERLPDIWVNPGQIVQVMTNLVQNAWEAMPQGGTLTLGLEGRYQNGTLIEVELTVEDSGPGIPAMIQNDVFNPFFTTKQTKGGRGLGLSISRAMTHRHGGTIRLVSPIHDGRGTRGVVVLPVLKEEATNA